MLQNANGVLIHHYCKQIHPNITQREIKPHPKSYNPRRNPGRKVSGSEEREIEKKNDVNSGHLVLQSTNLNWTKMFMFKSA